MRYIIEKGDVFKCIKTYRMESEEKAYTKGKQYFSEVGGCITDNEPDVNHSMQSEERLFEYFKLVL
jgi:hypothetical protein